MQTSDILLFDSGKFPVWFRLPALVFGIGTLFLGASLAAYGLFGVGLGIDWSDGSGSPLLGSAACFLIGVLWCFLWVAQLRVVFDDGKNELVVFRNGFIRTHEERIPLADCREIQVHKVRHWKGGYSWRFIVEYSRGGAARIVDISDDPEKLAGACATAVGVPVRRYG